MQKTKRVSAAGLAILATSCSAGMTVRRVSDDSSEVGIRYYDSAPYLLVHTNNDGGLTTRILYLPDLGRKMAVRPYNRGSSLKLTLNFANGVLTRADSTVDQTKLPAAVVSAIEKTAGAALAALSPANAPKAASPEVPTPYLFKIVIKGSSVTLVGGQPGTLDPSGANPVLVPTIHVDPVRGQP